MEQPLNGMLYRLLVSRFGDVEIVHPGEAMMSRAPERTRFIEGKSVKRRERVISHSGEEYRLNCPFCSDQRKRLFVNHMWAVEDKTTGSDNLWMMQCWNENCQADRVNQIKLRDLVFAFGGQRRKATKILPGRKPDMSSAGAAKLPGPHWRLDELMVKQPHHPAIEYLRTRQLDPAYMGREFNVGYCPESHYALAEHRIIFPFYMDQKLVGWQARYIGDWQKGMPPKYWTMPNMPRIKVAYNYDRAIQHQTIILVEGPTDVTNTGPQAMGLIGKTMSPYLRMRLIEDAPEDAVIVILLDPKQDAQAAAKRRVHHIEKLREQLKDPLCGRLLAVYLPEEYDPGSLDRTITRQIIREHAAKEGLRVSFAAPKAAKKKEKV